MGPLLFLGEVSKKKRPLLLEVSVVFFSNLKIIIISIALQEVTSLPVYSFFGSSAAGNGDGAGASLLKVTAATYHSPSVFFQTTRYLPMSKRSPCGDPITMRLIPYSQARSPDRETVIFEVVP